MRVVVEDLWLCGDCTYYAETADASYFDGVYEEPEASHRLEYVDKCLAQLGGNLVPDWDLEEKWYECYECGERCRESEVVKRLQGEYEDEEFLCPHCGEESLTERDRGYEEFSRRDCDCCGTTLAGDRHRFAILGE